MLDENLAKSALSARVVLQVEPVEPVKRVFIGVHVQRVHVEVVGTEVDGLEHLAQVQKLAVAVDDLLVRFAFQLGLDEPE